METDDGLYDSVVDLVGAGVPPAVRKSPNGEGDKATIDQKEGNEWNDR